MALDAAGTCDPAGPTERAACEASAGGSGAFTLDLTGELRARSHCRFVIPLIHFMPDSLTYSVLLYLKRHCDRTAGGHREGGLPRHHHQSLPRGRPRRAVRGGGCCRLASPRPALCAAHMHMSGTGYGTDDVLTARANLGRGMGSVLTGVMHRSLPALPGD